ncbi:tumor necrosis factor ligand superfamily member 14 [Rhinophrynus dorsalis]
MDTCVQYPMSVFTVEGQNVPTDPHTLPNKKKFVCSNSRIIQVVLIVLALLALCGAATEIYILRRLQNNLEATQEMIIENVSAQRMTPNPGDGKDTPVPSAHVTDFKNTNLYPGEPLQWEPSQGLSFLHKVQYNNGSLLSTESGLYFVYSKLQLGTMNCRKTNAPEFFYTHSVWKKSPNILKLTELMDNKRRFCDTEGGGSWRGSSFLGGIFHLNQGEEVFVKMSNKQLIRVKDGTTTFFGLFML